MYDYISLSIISIKYHYVFNSIITWLASSLWYCFHHCTGSYYLKKNPDGDGTILLRKKDNLDLLLKKIVLQYEPETYTSYINDDLTNMGIIDKLKVVLRQFKTEGKSFTFRQLEGCLQGVSTSYLRRIIIHPPFSDALTKTKANGSKTLYLVSGAI